MEIGENYVPGTTFNVADQNSNKQKSRFFSDKSSMDG